MQWTGINKYQILFGLYFPNILIKYQEISYLIQTEGVSWACEGIFRCKIIENNKCMSLIISIRELRKCIFPI